MKTWLWVLPFWAWHSVYVTLWTGWWYVWQKSTSYHQPTLSALYIRKEGTNRSVPWGGSNLKQTNTFVAWVLKEKQHKAYKWTYLQIFSVFRPCCSFSWDPLNVIQNTKTHPSIHTNPHTHSSIYPHAHTYTYPSIHTHPHTHPPTHTITHPSTHTHTHTHTHSPIHTHLHTYTQTHAHTHTHPYTHPPPTYTYQPIHTHIYTCTHTFTHPSTHTHTHTPPHTHTHKQTNKQNLKHNVQTCMCKCFHSGHQTCEESHLVQNRCRCCGCCLFLCWTVFWCPVSVGSHAGISVVDPHGGAFLWNIPCSNRHLFAHIKLDHNKILSAALKLTYFKTAPHY